MAATRCEWTASRDRGRAERRRTGHGEKLLFFARGVVEGRCCGPYAASNMGGRKQASCLTRPSGIKDREDDPRAARRGRSQELWSCDWPIAGRGQERPAKSERTSVGGGPSLWGARVGETWRGRLQADGDEVVGSTEYAAPWLHGTSGAQRSYTPVVLGRAYRSGSLVDPSRLYRLLTADQREDANDRSVTSDRHLDLSPHSRATTYQMAALFALSKHLAFSPRGVLRLVSPFLGRRTSQREMMSRCAALRVNPAQPRLGSCR